MVLVFGDSLTAWLRWIVGLISDRGDSLPERLPLRNLVLPREGGEDWCVDLRFPSSCGQRLEMMLLKEVKPRWNITSDKRGRPSLHPSVWLQSSKAAAELASIADVDGRRGHRRSAASPRRQVLPSNRTPRPAAVISAMGHGTKSLRDSPLKQAVGRGY